MNINCQLLLLLLNEFPSIVLCKLRKMIWFLPEGIRKCCNKKKKVIFEMGVEGHIRVEMEGKSRQRKQPEPTQKQENIGHM